ncbi:sensor histidine kinase [Alteromonas sediminis]|uniref:Sensor histidine kinase n=2 Tax=Alteromonas sediminis TaxID=2259342 RepID=A0A3N5Y1E7_9ALTE|nr:sensor histidine kinase [Alteromonas sediminis]
MKNSLSLLIQSIETLSLHVPLENKLAHDQISSTHYEALRLNTNLVQMLSLYRSGMSDLPLTVDEHNINDILADIEASNRYYCDQKGIELQWQCEPELCWFFDSELIYLLLNDAVINALRYGKTKVVMSASIELTKEGEQLLIAVSDDGDGYPESMLSTTNKQVHKPNLKEGRTGLGLFFASMIADAHDNNGRRGEISLENGGTLGGSVFRVKLP